MSQELARLRFQQKVCADKVLVPFKRLELNEEVRMKTGHRDWRSATVVGKTTFPRSVVVDTSSGKRYRRNSSHLQRSKAKIPEPMDLEPIKESAAEATSNISQQSTSDKSHQSTSNGIPVNTEGQPAQPYVTRSGRVVKKPDRYA